jgi:hypothetical protein
MGSREIRDGDGSPSLGAKQFARRSRRRRFVLAGALIVAVAVAGATLDLTHESDATVLPNAVAANGRIALLDPTLSLLTSVKPDGSARRVVARCRHVFTACRIRLFAWSPNGKRLLFFRADGDQFYVYSLYVVDADGRNVKRLANCGFCGTPVNSGAAWSPHGTSIVYSGKNGLFVVDARRGVRRRLTRCGTSCSDLFPAWSPNGSKIAFTRRGSLYTVKPNGSALTKLTSAHTRATRRGRPTADGSPSTGRTRSTSSTRTDRIRRCSSTVRPAAARVFRPGPPTALASFSSTRRARLARLPPRCG